MPKTKEEVREANRIYQANYRAKNQEKAKEAARAWNFKNKEKQRIRHLKNTYGITPDDYNDMFAAQNGCCKICGKHQQEFKKALCVDHNHETGNVRGLLCNNCNTMLGKAFDNKETLYNAIKYLEECDG